MLEAIILALCAVLLFLDLLAIHAATWGSASQEEIDYLNHEDEDE